MNSDFQVWLKALPALGYEPMWVQRNLPRLRQRFERDPSPMPSCPTPTDKIVDRYDEL